MKIFVSFFAKTNMKDEYNKRDALVIILLYITQAPAALISGIIGPIHVGNI